MTLFQSCDGSAPTSAVATHARWEAARAQLASGPLPAGEPSSHDCGDVSPGASQTPAESSGGQLRELLGRDVLLSARTRCARVECDRELSYEQRSQHVKWCSRACAEADAAQIIPRARKRAQAKFEGEDPWLS